MLVYFSSLGQSVYGSVGKLCIELSNIGLGIGTCVAFYIIIGDLLPPIVATTLGLEWVRVYYILYLLFLWSTHCHALIGSHVPPRGPPSVLWGICSVSPHTHTEC